MRVDLVVFEGVDELDVFGPLEVFRRTEALGAELTTRLCTGAPADHVTGAFSSRFMVDGTLVPGQADLVVVPGGGWVARSERGARAEAERGLITRLLVDAARSGSVMAGVCTGAMLLAHAGIIGSRAATTHHDAMADLAATGATVLPERVVDDGDLVTCGGVTSGIDLALHLVGRYLGDELAALVAEGLEYPWRSEALEGPAGWPPRPVAGLQTA